MSSYRRIYLVSCVSQKTPYPAPARDLYVSPLFQKERAYVLKSGSPWFILSAEHGLVHPDDVLAPYEKTLNNMRVAERRAWAEKVQSQMEQVLPDADEVIIFAGVRYREHLEPWLRHSFASVRVPMQSLQIGKRCSGYQKMSQIEDTIAFYTHLQELERRIGGKRSLDNSDGKRGWPERGVYFFFESSEHRSGSGVGPRVVRVGTHALTAKSRTTLWNRLRQHRGTLHPYGGNHRGSISRLLVGEALTRRGDVDSKDSWGRGSNAPPAVRESERPIEAQVSQYIGPMPFIFVPILDAPGGQ